MVSVVWSVVCGLWSVVWCGVVWCGVVRCGVVCVVWCGGVVWCGVVWCGVVWWKTPCVNSKSLRVNIQNVSVYVSNTRT